MIRSNTIWVVSSLKFTGNYQGKLINQAYTRNIKEKLQFRCIIFIWQIDIYLIFLLLFLFYFYVYFIIFYHGVFNLINLNVYFLWICKKYDCLKMDAAALETLQKSWNKWIFRNYLIFYFTWNIKCLKFSLGLTELYDIHCGDKKSKPCLLGSNFTDLILTGELSGVDSVRPLRQGFFIQLCNTN